VNLNPAVFATCSTNLVLQKGNRESKGKLLRGKSCAPLKMPDMSTLTKLRAERWLSACLRVPLIEGLAGGGSERSASQRRNFLDNDWREARVVNGARSIVVAVPYVACRLSAIRSSLGSRLALEAFLVDV
jgi:hypothetical protein